jgi:hypothetical protein
MYNTPSGYKNMDTRGMYNIRRGRGPKPRPNELKGQPVSNDLV